MSKISQTKLNRLFERNALTKNIERRDVSIAPISTQKVGDCYICHLPVHASPGQSLFWVEDILGNHLYSHKKCRKNEKIPH